MYDEVSNRHKFVPYIKRYPGLYDISIGSIDPAKTPAQGKVRLIRDNKSDRHHSD